MKRLIGILLVLVVTMGACGGSTPEPAEDGGIAALDGKNEKDAPSKDTGEKKDPGGTGTTKTKGSAGKAAPGGGGGKPSSTGGGGNGDQPDTSSGGKKPAPAAQAAAITPVPAGRYEYATDGERTVSGNSESLPKTTTLTAAAPADGLQRQTRDLRDSEGNGIVTETDLLYRDGNVYLSYVKITSRFQGGLTDVREFRLPEPELVAPRGGGPGFGRTFTMEGSGTRAKVAIEAGRFENVTAGGGQVRALVVQTNIEFSGALEGYQRSTSWFTPKHLLAVKEQVRTDVQNGPIRLQGNYEALIKRLP